MGSSTQVEQPPESSEQASGTHKIARAAGAASIAVFASRITGLAREIILTRRFGASMEYEAYLQGFRIPNLTRDLFAEGALSSAFVPVFVEYLTTKSKEEAARLANLVATGIMLIVGAVCLLMMVEAPALLDASASGFHNVPGKFEKAVQLTRIMSPFLLLVSLAAQAMGVLNALNIYALPAFSSTLFNVGSVAAGLFLGFVANGFLGISHIEGIAWGVVIGGAMQLLIQVPSLMKHGFVFKPVFDWSDPGLKRILKTMGPAIIGNAAVQINVFVNSNFASQIVDAQRGSNGAMSWLNCSFRFMQLPLGVFGVAIASATLPAISRAASLGDMTEFRRTLGRSLGMVLLLTVPSSVGLAILGQSVVGVIYEGGKFNHYDTEQTAYALSFFSIGLAAYSCLKVLTPAFYALKDSRTPMLISLVSVVVNYAIASRMTKHFGHAGLALSTSGVALTAAVAQFWILRGRLGVIGGAQLLSTATKVVIGSAAMAVVVWLCSAGLGRLAPAGKTLYWANILLTIPLGAVAYYWVCRALQVAELETASRAIMGPLSRLRAKIG